LGKKQSRRAPRGPAAVAPAKPARWRPAVSWVERHATLTLVILLAVASLRIIATYTVFNHTVDEPGHLACGMDWLEHGAFHYETQHPPLARVAAALGPYLAGLRGNREDDRLMAGADILYTGGRYDRNLALARLGILPFFWVASVVVFLWARKTFGPLCAVTAAFLFTFLPPVLAHAGLATTDMALTAFTVAAFFCGACWFERPTLARAACFGAATGLAVLSKFSALPFLPCAFLSAAAWTWWCLRPGLGQALKAIGRRVPTLLVAVLAGALAIWAGYRFTFGYAGLLGMKAPAPVFFDGIQSVMEHDRQGHTAYLFGQRSQFGFWYFFPVALAVKTPIPFLALLFAGAWLCLRKAERSDPWTGLPLAFSLGILVFSLFSHIDIGVRHVLPVYAGFSIAAAVAALRLFQLIGTVKWAPHALAALLVWHAATSAFAHPDYIPYFNFLAGAEPEKILVDSDLDWGQDMKRLARRLEELGAREVTFHPFITARLEAFHGFPPIHPMDPEFPSSGWDAVSLTAWKAGRLGLGTTRPDVQLWPDRIPPTEKLGKTTWLWYFPPERASR